MQTLLVYCRAYVTPTDTLKSMRMLLMLSQSLHIYRNVVVVHTPGFLFSLLSSYVLIFPGTHVVLCGEYLLAFLWGLACLPIAPSEV